MEYPVGNGLFTGQKTKISSQSHANDFGFS
jgi:hypothetical protein